MTIKIWRCKCKQFQMSDVEYESIIVDSLCPKCGRSLMDFKCEGIDRKNHKIRFLVTNKYNTTGEDKIWFSRPSTSLTSNIFNKGA